MENKNLIHRDMLVGDFGERFLDVLELAAVRPHDRGNSDVSEDEVVGPAPLLDEGQIPDKTAVPVALSQLER